MQLFAYTEKDQKYLANAMNMLTCPLYCFPFVSLRHNFHTTIGLECRKFPLAALTASIGVCVSVSNNPPSSFAIIKHKKPNITFRSKTKMPIYIWHLQQHQQQQKQQNLPPTASSVYVDIIDIVAVDSLKPLVIHIYPTIICARLYGCVYFVCYHELCTDTHTQHAHTPNVYINVQLELLCIVQIASNTGILI